MSCWGEQSAQLELYAVQRVTHVLHAQLHVVPV